MYGESATHGTVSRRTSTQDTADANYMLITVVVNGHNCVAIRYRTTTQGVNAAIEIKALDYNVAVYCRKSTYGERRICHMIWLASN